MSFCYLLPEPPLRTLQRFRRCSVHRKDRLYLWQRSHLEPSERRLNGLHNSWTTQAEKASFIYFWFSCLKTMASFQLGVGHSSSEQQWNVKSSSTTRHNIRYMWPWNVKVRLKIWRRNDVKPSLGGFCSSWLFGGYPEYKRVAQTMQHGTRGQMWAIRKVITSSKSVVTCIIHTLCHQVKTLV